MDANSLLETIVKVFGEERLEVVLIGNAAAALEGAPVTTDDFDFMFRPTRGNIAKMKLAAAQLGASLFQPEYPVSRFYRIINSGVGLQVDMMGVVDGVKSFESLRSRASRVSFGGGSLLVASLEDVIKSKRTAGRKKDLAVLPILEDTLKLRGGGAR
jgi:predicted nucleotidyltransferase